MNYTKFLIRYKDGMERCIIANHIQMDMRNLKAGVWLGYSYRIPGDDGIAEYHSDVDKTSIDLAKVEFIAELRGHYDGTFDELYYIYGKKAGDQHD